MLCYCRLCAKLKSTGEVLNLESDQETLKDLYAKLIFLNAVYVDISEKLDLPKTVCFDCFNSLNTAYQFFITVKEAQSVLLSLPPIKAVLSYDGIDKKPGKLKHESIERITQSGGFLDDDIKLDLDSDGKSRNCVTELQDEDVKNHKMIVNDLTDNLDLIKFKKIKKESRKKTKTSKKVRRQSSTKEYSNKVETQTWQTYRWTCGLCYTEFPDLARLRSHSITDHRKCAEYACFDCEKIFDFKLFILHARSHHFSLRNRCQYCDVALSPDELDSHVKKHLESSHPCPSCGEIFSDETSIQHHLDSLITKKPRKVGRMPRAPEKDRTCPTCNRVCERVSLLKKHMEIHKSDRNRDFTCELCGKAYYSKTDLRGHLLSHSNERTHTCSTCGKSFIKAIYLRKHIKRHSDIKLFSCSTCGRSFREKIHLTEHEIIHTDTFRYACNYCDKGFNYKSGLVIHERQHTGVKPYSCEECDRSFTDYSNFNKHMKRRHNREAKTSLSVREKCENDIEGHINEETIVPGKKRKKNT